MLCIQVSGSVALSLLLLFSLSLLPSSHFHTPTRWVDKLSPLVEGKVAAGLGLVETDGPYGGGCLQCKNHTHHHGVEDSVYWQTRLQTEFYNVMRSKGISVNAPDRYFGAGANKMMFYGDPTMVGRPRKMDLLLSRQMMFDNTFEWLSTQGWSLVPNEVRCCCCRCRCRW